MKNRVPRNLAFTIVGCFYPPVPETTTGTPSPTVATSPTGTPPLTTTALPPTTTTMNYCIQEQGMNQPLTIQSNQVTSNPLPDQTTPLSNINPTSTTPGVNFTSMVPQINITLDQPAALTLIYLPVDSPNQPSNVNQFTVQFLYPNGTLSPELPSTIPSISGTTTTTPSTGAPSETTTPPFISGFVPPSAVSPQVDLPPNFNVPANTTVIITITSTTDASYPYGVSVLFLYFPPFFRT
jgi:hypothetical protein